MTVADESDEELMARYGRGDASAFELLYRRHEMRVWRFLERNLRNRATADELMQEVWFAVAREATRYQPAARFTTWLFTITRNTILNEYRRRSRHPSESLDALQEPTSPESAGWQAADTSAPDPAQEAVEHELQEKVMEAIRDLPEAQRTAVILCRYEGLSYDEIAKVLKCSASATKSLLHRARLTLKEKLRGYY